MPATKTNAFNYTVRSFQQKYCCGYSLLHIIWLNMYLHIYKHKYIEYVGDLTELQLDT